MGIEGDYSTELDARTMHDLREGLTLTKGWLEALFRNWDFLDDSRKREMVAAALLGAHQVTYQVEKLEGRPVEEIPMPHERMAEEFLKLAEIDL